MNDNSKTALKIKEQIIKFGIKAGKGLKRPQQKFLTQAIYGIQASKDVKLSNISRSLKERIKLIKTENRLSRNLSSHKLDNTLTNNIIKLASSQIKEDTVLALDISDIRKEYAQKMDNLGEVRDGSSGEIASGYWLLSILGAEVKGQDLKPLFLKIYSAVADEFISENEEIIRAIKEVTAFIGNKGIWVIDRGGDREILYKDLKERPFVIRAKINRNVIYQDTVLNILTAVKLCGNYSDVEIKINTKGQEEKRKLTIGEISIKLPFQDLPLKLVIIKGFGEKPTLLITNLNKNKEEVLEIYLTRWKCEESFRFIKQGYNLEDIRVRNWQSLKNEIKHNISSILFYIHRTWEKNKAKHIT